MDAKKDGSSSDPAASADATSTIEAVKSGESSDDKSEAAAGKDSKWEGAAAAVTPEKLPTAGAEEALGQMLLAVTQQ